MLANGAIHIMTTVQLGNEEMGETIFQMNLGTVAPPCASEQYCTGGPR